MANKVAFRDRLRDRGFIDQWGFMIFAGLGFVGIVSAKAVGGGTQWVALGAVIAMLAYALVLGRAGTGRLRADQAGDNCYYLGLIYTLASLSYAIGTFNPNDTASTIVQGFGVALATTIFGLILRVFFSQGRPDLENHEEELRLELTEAVSRLKGELNGVVLSMNDFARRFQQSMEEMHGSATASIEQFTKSSVDGLKEVVEVAGETIRGEANDFAVRSKRYSTSFNNLLAKLDQHGSSVEQMSETHETLIQTATAAAAAAGSASAAVESLKQGAESASSVAVSTRDVVAMTQQLVSQLSATVGAVQTSLHALQTQTDRHMQEFASGPSDAAKNAISALTGASASLERQTSETAKLHADLHANFATQTAASLSLSARHNDELELQLERSRHLVTKVHAALADMTGNLAASLEGRT